MLNCVKEEVASIDSASSLLPPVHVTLGLVGVAAAVSLAAAAAAAAGCCAVTVLASATTSLLGRR